MHCQIEKQPAQKSNLRRCAVFKIDLNGRFVYVDNLTEQLLGLPDDKLFGRSIQEFVDEDSYATLLSIVKNRNHYETSFEAADIVFIDTRGKRRTLGVVVSLNFIGGSPANFQIVAISASEHAQEHIDPAFSNDINELLFDYVSDLDTDMNWQKLSGIFLKINEIEQVGIYMYEKEKLNLLVSASQPSCVEKGPDLTITDEKHLKVATLKIPYMDSVFIDDSLSADSASHELTELCYPLVHRKHCWGLLRIILKGDIPMVSSILRSSADFLGNALYSFINEMRAGVLLQKSNNPSG